MTSVASDLPGVGVFGTDAPTKILVPLLQKEGYHISALWGHTLQEADQTASELDIPYATNRIDDVLLRNDVNLVLILCPPAQHSTIAVRALGIGKHVSVQSPGGLSQEETLRMVQAAQYYPRLSATLNHGLRFLPCFSRMRSAVRSGYVGEVSLCDVRLNMGSLLGNKYSWLCCETMGGGVLNLFGAHLIDLLYFLLGKKVIRVQGIVRTFCKTTDEINGIRQINSDDMTSFQMEMEDGTFASVNINSKVANFHQEVVLCGPNGHLVARNGDLYGKKKGSGKKEDLLFADPNISPVETEPEADAISSSILPPLYLEGTVQMFRELVHRFQASAAFSSLENRQGNEDEAESLFPNFEDAQYAQAVIEAVRVSSRERKWTKVNVKANVEEQPEVSPSGSFFFSQKHNIPQLHLN